MQYRSLRPLRQRSRQHAIGFGLLAALLILNAVLSYFATNNLLEKERRIQGTLRFLVALEETFSALRAAEAGQRGYVITGEEKHLEPFENALARIDARTTVLRVLQSDLPEQEEQIDRLIELIRNKHDEMRSVVGLSRNELDAAALSLERSDQGYLVMQRIRALVEDMKAREYRLVQQQRLEARRSRTQVLIATSLATLVGVVLVIAVYVLIQRAIARQRADAEKLALSNEELESIVADRTAALERYSTELQRSNRELQAFAFIASHDLQEPLRKIRAFGDRLRRQSTREPLSDRSLDYVERMYSAAGRMSRLVNDLLEYSRVSTKAREFNRVSLQSVLDDVREDLSEVISAQGARITNGPLPEIDADAVQIRQLLQNLISNSLKFSHEEEPPEIHVESETFPGGRDSDHSEWCRLTVRDNGIGFEKHFAEQIFTPFQRLHGKHEYSGSGIGLAVCRRVVERHGGDIRAESSPGQGTRFIIDLPVYHGKDESPG